MNKYSIWNYSVISKFNKSVFGNLLTLNELKSNHEEMIKINGIEHFGYFFHVKIEKALYFFDSSSNILNTLPVAITYSKKHSYRNKVFEHVQDFDSFKIIPDNIYSMREIVEELNKIVHEKPNQLRDWIITCIASYCEKPMLRVASPKGFGKDSIPKILKGMLKGIYVFKPRSMAKIENVTHGIKSLYLNEMATTDKKQIELIEDYILGVGDGSTDYEKGARGYKGERENKDTNDISLVFMYNDLSQYDKDPSKFFDNMLVNESAYDRLLPLRFHGRINVAQFRRTFDIQEVADKNKQFFINMMKSIEYYRLNYRKELKPFRLLTKYVLSERHMNSFMILTDFINLYANTEEEFNVIVRDFYRHYEDYKIMVNGGKATLNVYQEVGVEEIKVKES